MTSILFHLGCPEPGLPFKIGALPTLHDRGAHEPRPLGGLGWSCTCAPHLQSPGRYSARGPTERPLPLPPGQHSLFPRHLYRSLHFERRSSTQYRPLRRPGVYAKVDAPKRHREPTER
ncbi:Hypothetical protein NTJ_10495 [Nesidiocoris tenuis]|uniref:Uncharacterized protein n=1 Tax=Nesidiocoris tenuis TaxID=355587 RepID=A0ABN7B3D3_9HEMI|nr:Hypothetical protein NTJ_10495 [Nesidiocoris tenuis]